jgi:hypothetical protein
MKRRAIAKETNVPNAIAMYGLKLLIRIVAMLTKLARVSD